MGELAEALSLIVAARAATDETNRNSILDEAAALIGKAIGERDVAEGDLSWAEKDLLTIFAARDMRPRQELFGNSLMPAWGTRDHSSLQPAIDALAARGWIDDSRKASISLTDAGHAEIKRRGL